MMAFGDFQHLRVGHSGAMLSKPGRCSCPLAGGVTMDGAEQKKDCSYIEIPSADPLLASGLVKVCGVAMNDREKLDTRSMQRR
jgi:hypothetical protein